MLVTIHPTAISLHPRRPSGSQRNVWPTTVELVEPMGDTVRVTLGDPVPIAVGRHPRSRFIAGPDSGTDVWAAVKATEINATRA